MKILFVLKKRTRLNQKTDVYVGLTTGLYNSVKFVHDFLTTNNIQSKMFIANDNNDIDREVTSYKPTHVIIEALWVVPSKFVILQRLHPNVKWIVRLHSELPFIAGEGIAMDWIGEYSTFNNVMVACNSLRMLNEMRFYIGSKFPSMSQSNVDKKVIYLPNCYPLNFININNSIEQEPDQNTACCFKHNTTNNTNTTNTTTINNTTTNTNTTNKQDKVDTHTHIINIGCFGAVRPLKNHLMQALASIKVAEKLHKKLYFHINADRLEMNGEPTLHNLIGLFKQLSDKGHKLISHEWSDHEEFKELCSKMDIGLQISFTETFNIVGADFVSMGIPFLGSSEIPWMDSTYCCNPVDFDNIYEKIISTYYNVEKNVTNNQKCLTKYVRNSVDVWCKYFQ